MDDPVNGPHVRWTETADRVTIDVPGELRAAFLAVLSLGMVIELVVVKPPAGLVVLFLATLGCTVAAIALGSRLPARMEVGVHRCTGVVGVWPLVHRYAVGWGEIRDLVSRDRELLLVLRDGRTVATGLRLIEADRQRAQRLLDERIRAHRGSIAAQDPRLELLRNPR